MCIRHEGNTHKTLHFRQQNKPDKDRQLANRGSNVQVDREKHLSEKSPEERGG